MDSYPVASFSNLCDSIICLRFHSLNCLVRTVSVLEVNKKRKAGFQPVSFTQGVEDMSMLLSEQRPYPLCSFFFSSSHLCLLSFTHYALLLSLIPKLTRGALSKQVVPLFSSAALVWNLCPFLLPLVSSKGWAEGQSLGSLTTHLPDSPSPLQVFIIYLFIYFYSKDNDFLNMLSLLLW